MRQLFLILAIFLNLAIAHAQADSLKPLGKVYQKIDVVVKLHITLKQIFNSSHGESFELEISTAVTMRDLDSVFSRGDTFAIKLANLQNTDSVQVKYSYTPACINCTAFLVIEDSVQTRIISNKAKGVSPSLTFALNTLVDYKNKTQINTIPIYYTESTMKNPSDKIVLFTIKLE